MRLPPTSSSRSYLAIVDRRETNGWSIFFFLLFFLFRYSLINTKQEGKKKKRFPLDAQHARTWLETWNWQEEGRASSLYRVLLVLLMPLVRRSFKNRIKSAVQHTSHVEYLPFAVGSRVVGLSGCPVVASRVVVSTIINTGLKNMMQLLQMCMGVVTVAST